MRCVIEMGEWLVMARLSQAEPDLEGYGKKVRAAEGGQVLRYASASAMGGVIQTNRITIRSNFGEFFLNDRGEKLQI